MTNSTTTAVIGLSDETLSKLRELRRLCVDSAKGFEECAEMVQDHGVKAAFSEIAHERREHAQALATQIEWNDKDEEENGSYLAAFHRAWIKVRERCSSDTVEAIVCEAKRGESVLAEAYEDANLDCAATPVGDLIARQAEAIRQTQSRLEGLCTAKS